MTPNPVRFRSRLGRALARAALALLLGTSLAASAAQQPKPLKSVWHADIDGDRRSEVFTYTLTERGDRYAGSLVIRSDKGILWSHRWDMAASDLVGDLLHEEGDIAAQQWVERFFDGGLQYGAKLERRKLRADELDPELLDRAVRRSRISAAALERAILAQPVNVVFTYRASWREDIVLLVYVPPLKRCVRYHKGPY